MGSGKVGTYGKGEGKRADRQTEQERGSDGRCERNGSMGGRGRMMEGGGRIKERESTRGGLSKMEEGKKRRVGVGM